MIVRFLQIRGTHLTNLLDFYNYPQLGIDFLLSGTTHLVKKIILHSNIVRRSLIGNEISNAQLAWFAHVSTISEMPVGVRYGPNLGRQSEETR